MTPLVEVWRSRMGPDGRPCVLIDAESLELVRDIFISLEIAECESQPELAPLSAAIEEAIQRIREN